MANLCLLELSIIGFYSCGQLALVVETLGSVKSYMKRLSLGQLQPTSFH